ncbi:MAG: PilT/PilU family type 4a pilus ATPase [Andreesenia angusta]|nr:PilT/PilU family type 4a pilus ATPase [Andreesenia angusta]
MAYSHLKKIDNIIIEIVKKNITDLHIKSGGNIYYRKNKRIYKSDRKTDYRSIERFISRQFSLEEMKIYNKYGNLDKSLKIDKNRLRMNIYKEDNGINMAIRVLRDEIIEYKNLRLPEQIEDLIYSNQGLILITGSTGSGKSTTVASIISEINKNRNKHIILIEDPIEYIHKDKKSMITQIEIGKDCLDFSTAIRACLRQDPDIIVIGEIRDRESLEIALRAAETGHLVISTLHTNSASETIERITEMYSLKHQSQIRYLLSRTLKLIISQELVFKENRLYPIFEIMIVNNAIRNIIRMNKSFQIDNIIKTSRKIGMIDKEKFKSEIEKEENFI